MKYPQRPIDVRIRELQNFLMKDHFLSKSLWRDIEREFTYNRAGKNQTILLAGHTEKYFRFLVSGIAKITYYTQNESYVCGFKKSSSFVYDSVSFFNREASCFSIVALTDCTWLETGQSGIHKLIQQNRSFIGVLTQSINKDLKQAQKQYASLRTCSAKERYTKFCKSNPEVLQHASLGDIASFLGIRQQSLSRIRKDILV